MPWAHDGLWRALAERTALLIVDGENAIIDAGPAGTIRVDDRDAKSDVVCTTTTRTIIDLIQGRDTLLEAVLSDRVELIGAADALLSWLDALALFLHGAVRARAFEDLLVEFQRRSIERRERA